MFFAALILAAGLSKRMGKNKMLVDADGMPMVRRVFENVRQSDVDKIFVVTGSMAEAVESALAGCDYNAVFNERYKKGMGTSISAGVKYISSCSYDALLIFHGDMPFVKLETVNILINSYKQTKSKIIAPFYKNKRGHPVLFDRSFFPALTRLDGDFGAKKILEQNRSDMLSVNIDDPGILIDIDNEFFKNLYCNPI